jgi:cytochrome c oxidase subunit 2
MRPWGLLIIALVCFGLAAALWGAGIQPRGGSVWICPTCGAQWYHGGGGTFEPVVPPQGDQGMMGPGGYGPGMMGPRGHGPGMMGPGMMGPQGPAPFYVPHKASYSSPGEKIYDADIAPDGARISYRDGPPWLYMHGGSCVSCHGSNGRGGRPIPPAGIRAPDIRYSVLTGKVQPAEESGHHHEHHYTDATIKRAVTKGLDDDGKPLDRMMPRFEMSDEDAGYVVDYLKQLSKAG